MKRFRLPGRIVAVLAVTAQLSLLSVAIAGPLAGNRVLEDDLITVDGEDAVQEAASTSQAAAPQARPTSAGELVSSYVNSMRQQLLPDLSTDITQQQDAVDLDGLQGWSLEEISKAMGLLADQSYNENADAQTLSAQSQSFDLNVSVEDLYNFNAGHYFVVDQLEDGTEQGRLVTNSRIPELIGISALGGMDFNTVVQTGSEFNLDVTKRNVMFDTAFFETASRSTTATRIPGNTSFGSRFSPGGQSSGGGSGNVENTEAIPMAEFIQRIITGIRENWFNLIFGGLGVGGIVYVATRFGS